MEPTSIDDEDANDEDVSLGTFLYEALPGADIDSVEAVRDLRERE